MPEPTVEGRVAHTRELLSKQYGIRVDSVRIQDLTEEQIAQAGRLLELPNPEYAGSVEACIVQDADTRTTRYDLIVSRKG